MTARTSLRRRPLRRPPRTEAGPRPCRRDHRGSSKPNTAAAADTAGVRCPTRSRDRPGEGRLAEGHPASEWLGAARSGSSVVSTAGTCLPGGALVRLRIGARLGVHDLRRARARHGYRTVHDHLHVRRRGPWPSYRKFWFQVASLPIGDYPYAPANSRKLSVLVGGHPSTGHARRRHRTHRR